jgi:uncharacterized membrane protein YeiH
MTPLPAPAELIYAIGMAAVAVNAASAVLETEDKKMDLVGAVVVGLATSLGGGTLRDLLLDRQVFWLADVAYLVCGLLAVAITFLLARRIRVPPGLFVVPDRRRGRRALAGSLVAGGDHRRCRRHAARYPGQ